MTAMSECDNPLRSAFWSGRVDARPVALLRVAVGLVLCADLVDRLRDFHAFYTVGGAVVPSSSPLGWPTWTFFAASDDPRWAIALYVMGLGAAVALTFGFVTRAASVAAWAFVMSLQHRNPWVCNGGDSVLRLLLFWGMFARWGACLSLDVALGRRPAASHVPALPVRLLQLQVVVIYLVTAASKRGETWRDGSAIGRVLTSGDWARGVGPWLGAHPQLCVALTYGVLAIEWSLPWLLLMPWRADRVRAVALALAVALHVGIFATLRVGLFSEIMPASFFVFVRPRWLDWAAQRWRALASPSSSPPMRPLGLVVTAFLLSTVAIVGADFAWRSLRGGQERPRVLAALVGGLAMDQRWEMFAPDVPRVAIGWTAPAELADGRTVDLTTDLLPGLGPHHGFVYSRWHKLREVIAMGRPSLSRALGRYVCHLSGALLPSRVVSFQLVMHVRSLDPPRPDDVSVHLRQSCGQGH